MPPHTFIIQNILSITTYLVYFVDILQSFCELGIFTEQSRSGTFPRLWPWVCPLSDVSIVKLSSLMFKKE